MRAQTRDGGDIRRELIATTRLKNYQEISTSRMVKNASPSEVQATFNQYIGRRSQQLTRVTRLVQICDAWMVRKSRTLCKDSTLHALFRRR